MTAMKSEIIVDLPGIVLTYYPDAKIIHHEMRKYPGTEVLEATLEKGLEIIRNRGAHKWLSDDRKGGALPKSHHEWGDHVWGPAAAAAGWKYWALLPPTEVLGSTNMRRLAATYASLGVMVETFGDLKLAMAWLLAQP
jgi:hypothetical protein